MTHGVKRKLGYDDLAQMPDDGLTREVLDGELFVTPSPAPRPQRASKRLQRQLEAYFEARGLGEVFNAPLDTILGPHDIVEPDILVVTNADSISARAIEGPPAIVVEILSPSTAVRDTTLKKRRYAWAGVAHYWIVDIDARRLECLRLEGGDYTIAATAQDEEILRHPDWQGLQVSLSELCR